jgi:radical SAM protein with 4Fe4S-binding SPASM domain
MKTGPFHIARDLLNEGSKRLGNYLIRNYPVRDALRWMVERNERGETPLSRLFDHYVNGTADGGMRSPYFLPSLGLDGLNRISGIPKDYAIEKLFARKFVTQSIIHAIRSVAELGVTKPQHFVSPVLLVWNFTQRCNLACSHCYQNAGTKKVRELTLNEKLDLVEQLYDLKVPMLALSGGEPMKGPHFWKVIEKMGKRNFYSSVATNATLIDRNRAARMADLGVDYVQISLDSVDPAKHDAFRGKGCWEAAIRGVKNVVAQDGIEVGIASTMTQDNLEELEDLIKLAIDLGCDYFYTYNFIPVGRARDIPEKDLTPEQREGMFDVCYRYFDKIDFGSTAPQMIRRCMELAGPEGRTLSSHLAAEMGGKFGKNLGEIFGGCGCGRVYCTVQPDGIVTPCVYMPIPVGDLRKERFVDIWNGSAVFDVFKDRDDRTGHCLTCDYKYHCGGCRARAYAYSGDYRASDPGCKFNQGLWDEMNRNKPLRPAEDVHSNLEA